MLTQIQNPPSTKSTQQTNQQAQEVLTHFQQSEFNHDLIMQQISHILTQYFQQGNQEDIKVKDKIFKNKIRKNFSMIEIGVKEKRKMEDQIDLLRRVFVSINMKKVKFMCRPVMLSRKSSFQMNQNGNFLPIFTKNEGQTIYLYFIMLLDNILQMQQPQKMNQRATHFVLGSTGQPGGSIYTVDYTRKQAEHDPNYKVLDPFKGSALNQNYKGNFATTNKTMLKNWQNAQRAGLDKDKLKDLRTHHFNLGSYNPSQSATTNQHYYDQKQLSNDALKNMEQAKNRMRSHYHDFKEQPYTNFKSTYNKEYSAKEGEMARCAKPENAQNAIVFGNHNIPMMTTNNADYTKKQLAQNQAKSTLQQSSSLVLGDKSQSMETTNQVYYHEKPIVRNQLPEATMKELRNTHFNLGGMGTNFQTEMASKYNAPPPEALSNYKSVPHYESGKWVPKDAKFDGRTTNNRDLPAREIKPYTKAEPKTRSQFNLGNQGNNYTTEFGQNFTQKQPTYGGKAQKPKDNVTTGFDKGTYETEHRSSFKERNLADAKCKIDIAALSKADHFQIGGSNSQCNMTVYMDEYRRDQANKSKLFHKDNQ